MIKVWFSGFLVLFKNELPPLRKIEFPLYRLTSSAFPETATLNSDNHTKHMNRISVVKVCATRSSPWSLNSKLVCAYNKTGF
jgi:hypothetical protein